MLKEKIQSFLISAGEYACYALSIIKIAEEVNNSHIDVITALESGIERGYIAFNYDDYNDSNNFYINDAARFLSMLTEDVWTLKHLPGAYKAKPGEKVIYRWERKTVKGVISHFRLPEWDSLENSQTVKYGQIVSSRVFIRLG